MVVWPDDPLSPVVMTCQVKCSPPNESWRPSPVTWPGVSSANVYSGSPSSVARPAGPLGNCVYAAGVPMVPLLLDLGPASVRRLALDQLTDGPICGLGPYQFDGDLLRIRRVAGTLRLRAAAEGLRDYEVTFDATPRNMVPTR